MHALSALRRKRDEIASTIAAYEAKIADARTDLAALDQAARLFDPGAESDEPSIRRELGWHRTSTDPGSRSLGAYAPLGAPRRQVKRLRR